MSEQEPFEPKILGFLCNWCSYAGADLAGVSRYQYPTNLRVVKVMCSTRVDPTIVLEAFMHQVDGVMVLGCHFGDCHYITGNYYTEIRMKTTQEFLKIIGVKPKRLLIDWVSATEGERFATLVEEFTETIKELGPISSDLPQEELKARLTAARDTLSQQRMRWLINMERKLLEEGSVFGDKVDLEALNKAKFEALVKEYEKNKILLSLSDKTLSIKDIAQTTAISPQEVLRNLVALEQNGLVTISEIDGVSPKYRRLGG